MSHELQGAVDAVRQINLNRGCPHTIPRVDGTSTVPVANLHPDARKQEYYFLLDTFLPATIDVVRTFRDRFPGGLAARDQSGDLVSGLPAMQERVRPHVAAGEFLPATYWVHDAVVRTLNIASEVWFAAADRQSSDFRRINQLVGDPYKNAFGERAIQKAVASAASQTVFISCGFHQMIHDQYGAAEGEPLTPARMRELHDDHLRAAMPLTNLHFTETGNIIGLLEPRFLPGGSVAIYAHNDYFVQSDDMLYTPAGRLVEDLAELHPGTFPDGRIGCPGAKYVPEIWGWIGELCSEHAYPALAPSEYNFTVPQSLPHTTN